MIATKKQQQQKKQVNTKNENKQKKTNKQRKGKILLTGEQILHRDIQNEGNLNEVVLFRVSWKQIEFASRRCVKVSSNSDLKRIRN